MTTNIRTNTALSVADAVGSETLPTLEAMRGEWWFGVDAESSTYNRITGVNGVEVGTAPPIYSPGYMTCQYNPKSGIRTDISLPTVATVIALVRNTAGGASIMISPGDLSDWNLMGLGANNKISAGQNGNATSLPQSIVDVPAATFTLVMGLYLPATLSRVYARVGNETRMDDAEGGYSQNGIRAGGLILFGGRPNDNIDSTFDIAAAAVREGLYGQTWMDEIAQIWLPIAASRGVPVS